MSCPTLNLPLDFDQFEAACLKLKQEHDIEIEPGTLSGDITQSGAHIHWEYDGHSLLTIMILSKPFFINCDKANSLLKGLFSGE